MTSRNSEVYMIFQAIHPTGPGEGYAIWKDHEEVSDIEQKLYLW